VRDLKASVKRPLRQLRGFERVNLEPGESRRVEFMLNDQHLSFWNAKLERVVEPGMFRVMVGGSSDAKLEADFSLAPPDGR
jgi:beta-glucosidase